MNPHDFEVIEVKHYGSIGAGTVVPFAPRAETNLAIIPRGLAKPEQAGTFDVCGNSLIGDGITDGDILCFRTNHSSADVTKDSICIARIVSTGEILAKRVLTNNGRITLRSSNPGYPDREFDVFEIEVMGLVFALQRMADRCGRFPVSGITYEIPENYL